MNDITNNNYPYGWVKFPMDYSFGANAGSLFEDWDSTRGTYYTLYRVYDSRVGRWYQVEILVDKYPAESGYNYAFRNPTISVDVYGSDTAFADDNARQMFNKVYSTVSERVSELESRIKEIESLLESGNLRKKERKRYNRELSALKREYSAVSSIKKMLDDIIASDVVFEYSTKPYTGNSGGVFGKTELRGPGASKVKIWVYEGFYSTFIHESRHAVGYIYGEFVLGYYDFMDEYEAFKMEEVYFKYLSDILPTNDIEYSNLIYVFSTFPNVWQDTVVSRTRRMYGTLYPDAVVIKEAEVIIENITRQTGGDALKIYIKWNYHMTPGIRKQFIQYKFK